MEQSQYHVPEVPGRELMAKSIHSGSYGPWLRWFADQLLYRTSQWYSCRCRLIWKLKETPFNRRFLQLQVVRDNRIGPMLLPTPTTGNNRNSRNAVHKIGAAHKNHGVALGLAQVLEIATGILPKEFDDWSQVPQFYRKLIPTPTSGIYRGGRHPENLKRLGRKPSNSLGDYINAIAGKVIKLSPSFIMEMMGFPADWILIPFLKKSCD